jgi:hypothetical protein
MHLKPNAVLMLADRRCRDLQAGAARLRIAREAYGGDSMLPPTISVASRQLGVTIGRALQQQEPTRRTILAPIRGAFPR